MKLKLIALSFITCLFVVSFGFSKESKPPEIFIDKGACPFECCVYRKWYVEKETKLFEMPDINSKVVTTIKPGINVEAITGEVHVTAGLFIVEKEFSTYKPGDHVYIYTYYGEGYFKVWYNGQFHEEGFDFSPYGSDKYKSEVGEFKQEPVSIWWAEIQTQSGRIGWSNRVDNFSNKDACG